MQSEHWDSPGQGVDSSTAVCALVESNGALAMKADKLGQFGSKNKLEFYVKTDQGLPDISVNLSGAKVPSLDVW